ncbi:LOW QUALITY PROTEIN: protein translocase subunit SecA-like [Aulostomus maculatus]
MSRACLESLFSCMVLFQDSKEQIKELFHMVSTLVAQQLWSPVEALNLTVALIDHHHKENCMSIMKILHLIETYQVTSEWTDEKNQSLLNILSSSETEKLIQNLEKSFTDEKVKSIDCLFDELRQMKNIDEQILEKSYRGVKAVENLIKSGEIKNHGDVDRARSLSDSSKTEDLQEVLAVLCNAVHLCKAERKWWPRATQMTSWFLLALSDTGKLLEMGTGEGKSCVIAMFAVLRALRGEKVDVLSSSSVLCERDAQEWSKFFSYFGLTADANTNKSEDNQRKECYQKDIVYGTIEAFAADHLRQIFEMKDVRSDRSYQCIIVDEVDSLMLDQGVQLTYLSSPMASMEHLNVILAMIWGHVSQYGFLSTGDETLVQSPPASFFKAIFDSMDTEETDIDDPMDILHLAEECHIVPEGFTQEIHKREKDDLLRKLKTVSEDKVVDFFQAIEEYVPYGFTVYTLNDNGMLDLKKANSYTNPDIPHLKFLVLGDGLCCSLYDSEETVIKPIAEVISGKIQYTPCENNKDKISIPGFLRNLIEKKASVWVENAFLAMRLREGREYVVEKDSICPVDFRSTGIVELSKKWGDGLQQFVEIKHQIKLSTISIVTNYISNIALFEKYNGKIYGTTGTLGNEAELRFLQDLYPNLSACQMPTFNRRKLFEVKGTLTSSAEEWKSEIKRVALSQISSNSYREGRAALVICETINKANQIYEELKSIIPGEIILYCRSDKDSLSKIEKELLPGDVIVATNLAGRGTDIKVSKQVNNNGGLFVILSFLTENTRVERQAFGRTARKGKPGSAQVIMTTDHLQDFFRTASSLEDAKKTRDRNASEKCNDMMDEVTEMKLREDLFSEYCKTLQEIHRNTPEDEKRAVVAVMNEFWGIWLQTKSDEIEQLKREELQKSLTADVALAKSQSQSRRHLCLAFTTTSNLGISHWMKKSGMSPAGCLRKQWCRMKVGQP